jgi:hypothetical protein
LRENQKAFLAAAYRLLEGNPANLINMFRVGEELSLASAETKGVVRDLIAEGLIRHEMDRHRISLTVAGCRRFEGYGQISAWPPERREAAGQEGGVFISYSHRDSRWLERLVVHLSPLARKGTEIWFDRRIEPGRIWEAEIQQALERTVIAVPLVSAYFLHSDFINHEEIPRLLAAAENRGMMLVPVILSESGFERSALARFQAFNPVSRPLIQMTRGEQERTLAGLAAAIEDWLGRS